MTIAHIAEDMHLLKIKQVFVIQPFVDIIPNSVIIVDIFIVTDSLFVFHAIQQQLDEHCVKH